MARADHIVLLTSALTLVCWSGLSTAYSSGAPAHTCSSMLPGHGLPELTDDQGCTLTFAGSVREGSKQRLTLNCGGTSFRGFHIQCRAGGEDGAAAGQFTATSNSRVFTCGGKQASAITHTSRTGKTSMEIDWEPDQAACQGNIQCRATVVFQYTQYTRLVRGAVTQCAAPATTAPPSCPANQEYRECGTLCEPTCEGSACSCPEACRAGCFCREGFVRHDGDCVPLSQCPVPGSQAGRQACSCVPECTAPGTAQYRVEFNAEWTAPPPPRRSPHWSSFVGASHSPCAVLWRNGTLATLGVKNVAEFGSNSAINREVRNLDCYQGAYFSAGGIGSSAGQVRANVMVDRYNHLISGMSMIAPSPDWIVGIDSIPVCKGSEWLDRIEYHAHLWDAGTDSGLRFTSRNQATNPREIIQRIRSNTPQLSLSSQGYSARLGTIVLRRISVNPRGVPRSQPECTQCPKGVQCVASYDVTVMNRPTCGANEAFSTCGSPCPETCEGSPFACATVCEQGCFCTTGHVRHEGRCIERSACPVEETTVPAAPTTPTCPANEIFSGCGAACIETCDGAPAFCTLACVPGCVCTSGYVRHEGSCIERSACPAEETSAPAAPTIPTCPANEVFSSCGAACIETCDGAPAVCALICVPGCVCTGGYVRHDGSCIERSACPAEGPSGPPAPGPVTHTVGGKCRNVGVAGGFGICISDCAGDSDCTGGDLCCQNECGGQVCSAPCPVLTCPVQCDVFSNGDNGCPTCSCERAISPGPPAPGPPAPGPPAPGPPAPGPPAPGPVTHTVGGKCRNVGVAGGFGICISDCAGDSDCTGGDLCCQNECGGQVCSAPCPVLTCPVQCDVFSNGDNGCPTCSCERPSGPPSPGPPAPGPPAPGPPAPGPPASGPVTHTVGGKCRNVGVAGGFGICISDCAGDSDCTGGDLCCQNECGGQVCSAPCPVLTCPVQCDVFSNGDNGCPTCSCERAVTPPEPTTPTCPPNEVHDSCGSSCPETCAGIPFICDFRCVEGCFCAPGYIRHEGICIEPSACPGSPGPPSPGPPSPGPPAPGPPATGPVTHTVGGKCRNVGVAGGFGICISDCAGDSDCTGGDLCCQNECGGQVCSAPCPVLTCPVQCDVFSNGDNGCPTCSCDSPIITTPPPPVDLCSLVTCQGLNCAPGTAAARVPGACCDTCEPTAITNVCGAFEESIPCAELCPAKCSNRGLLFACPPDCSQQGCTCIEGYVRDENDRCIREIDCDQGPIITTPPVDLCSLVTCQGLNCAPGTAAARVPGACCDTCEPTDNTNVCGAFEESIPCAELCPAKCSNRGLLFACPPDCSQQGCTCIEGYVRDENDRCIREIDCDQGPIITTPPVDLCSLVTCQGLNCAPGTAAARVPGACCDTCEPTAITNVCGSFEESIPCAELCPAKCSNRGLLFACPPDCSQQGCTCIEGYVRDENNRCIREIDCDQGPANHTVGGKCRNLGVAGGFGICISDCAGDSDCTGGDLCCQNECGGQVCSAPCPVLTCPVQCDVFSNGDNGCPTCSCENVCGAFEESIPCAELCPAKCSNRGLLFACPPDCSQQGCTCIEGYVRDENDRCIRESDCDQGSCAANEEYRQCTTPCPPTCATLGQPRPCPAICLAPGCECKRGFARSDNGTCIRQEDCRQAPIDPCEGVLCRPPFAFGGCPPGTISRTRPGACCPTCEPLILCSSSPFSCFNVSCPTLTSCPLGLAPTSFPCGCCDRCPRIETGTTYGVCNGRRVQCMVKECPTGYEHAFIDSQCCPVCLRYLANNCREPKSVGPCKALIPRWFYNTDSDQCERFDWGGCRPNNNNWREESACQRSCNTDLYEPEPGTSCQYVTCEIPTCPPGQTLRNVTGQCCPVCQSGGAQCGVNEVFQACAHQCPARCSNRGLAFACAPDCETGGCNCRPGYLRDDIGVCVSEADCPPLDPCPNGPCPLPFCTEGYVPLRLPGECCETCHPAPVPPTVPARCRGIVCDIPQCERLGLVVNYSSEACCPFCSPRPGCEGVECVETACPPDTEAQYPPRSCCPICLPPASPPPPTAPCHGIACDIPNCGALNMVVNYTSGSCCPTCSPRPPLPAKCAAVTCLAIEICDDGTYPVVYPDECCAVCPSLPLPVDPRPDHCRDIVCDIPQCGRLGLVVNYSSEACCPFCSPPPRTHRQNCTGIGCPLYKCLPGSILVYKNGDCCRTCSLPPTDECEGIACDIPQCGPGFELNFTAGCCPVCAPVDPCAGISCSIPLCEDGYHVNYTAGTCCPVCTEIPPPDCRTVRCRAPPKCVKGVAARVAKGECCESCPNWNGQCPSQRQCAHFNPVGHRDQCCPACNLTISQCDGIRCPPIRGCRRYASEVQVGECCLRCIKRRRRINNNPRAVCADVVCPRGMACSKRNNRAQCVCKKCSNVTDPMRQVTGKDGKTYASSCHRLRQACMTCSGI
ncbi:zonadhesin-like isoform X3 [Sycon ciliatum]|uniref:zonadhesin-like isoform X3 n=1 Tax=Sycon ciliatum TaxID=27933 RepID=UPI0031F69CDB